MYTTLRYVNLLSQANKNFLNFTIDVCEWEVMIKIMFILSVLWLPIKLPDKS